MDATPARPTPSTLRRRIYVACIGLAVAWAVAVFVFFFQVVRTEIAPAFVIGLLPLVTFLVVGRRFRKP